MRQEPFALSVPAQRRLRRSQLMPGAAGDLPLPRNRRADLFTGRGADEPDEAPERDGYRVELIGQRGP